MKLFDILSDEENRHIPLIGLTDVDGIIISPDVLLTGTYESALAYFGDTPVLYGATLSFAASAVDNGVRVDLLPDQHFDARFGSEYVSCRTMLKPKVAGSYPISRTPQATDESFRLFHRGYDLDKNTFTRPQPHEFFLSEMTEEMDEEDMRHAIEALGHLLPTDTLRIAYERRPERGLAIMTVKQLLRGYEHLDTIMRERFEAQVERKERMVIGDIDDRRDGRAAYDEYSGLLWDPAYNQWPHKLLPAEYYRQAQAKPGRGKKS